ncbi:MAG: right-handed parallel beta-helix repeat-containing protein, partial [Bacteroidia bacterium]|nr:right-handed parallel beta-helix repeat-containing protein [Bacteroidia bacterium]
TIGTYQTASNNNLFYAGTPGSNNLIYTDGTTDYQLIKPYKTAMVSRDQNSNRATISFLSTAIASANFLRPDPSVNSYAESTGLDISGVTDDIDNTNVRTGYPLSGQVNGGGQFPDIGAVEYDGKGLPPLSGTFTVGTGEDYETLREAIIDLNLHGVTSPGITFNVKAGHTETFTSSTAGQINVSGSSSAPIVFQKDGVGANPLITSGIGVGSYDGIIIINGGDYITFDGIDVKDNVANVTSTTQMEWGYALLKPSATDGVKNVLIKNSTITLQYSNTSTRGIYMDNRNTSGGTHIISTSEGKHQDNTIQNNTIKTAYIGIYLNGYNAVNYYDSNIVVTGNTVDDFKQYGIFSYYQHQNTITQNVVKNASFTSQVYGIYVYGREVNILRNKISGLSTTYTSSFATYGIYAGGPSPSGTLKIHNNMVANLTAPSSTNVSAVNGIYTSFYGTSEVYYNTVYLNCTSGGVGFGSNAFYISYTSYYSKIRNNIFVNASTYGTAVAQRHSSSSVLSYYDATSNNNLYYAGTPGSSNLIFANGTNYQTLTNFKGLVLPKDGNSRTENITLLSTDITNVNFLKPDPTIASAIESGAEEIAGVTDDNANANIRTGYPLTGQVNGGGTAPDMGAVEFDGTPMPVLSGTKTVGTGKDYATIEAAIDELNNKNIGTGGVTFKVDAGHTETFTSNMAGIITNTGTASKPIVFQKDGVGANPIITSGTGTGIYDGIIIINGGDYITFDGIDVKDNVANVTSTTQMEWGYALLKPSATDGVKNVLIKNSTITLQYSNTSTRGIYMDNRNTSGGTHIISTSEGKHQDNTIQNNTIKTAYIGIYLNGYNAVNYYDSNIVVTGNTVDDFKQYGIFSYYQHQNTITQNVVKNASFTSQVYGIYVYGREVNILRNKISGLSTTYTSSFATYGIYAGGPSPSGTLKIHNNMVANLTAPSSTNVSAVNGIYTSFYGTSEVYYNTVYLNCTSGGVGFGSNAFYISYTSYYSKIRNNIFVNASTYGTAVAQRHSSSSVLSYYDATSNNNLYYAGTPGSSNLIFANGTNYQTLANFQAIVSPRDANSKTENVTLLSSDITNVNFLKPDPTIISVIESGAEEIAGVTDDNANANIRTGYPLIGQVNGGGDAPDMGAVESDGTPIPPLVGIKTVGTGKDYSTIEAAIADLNSKNIGTGGVTFKVDAGHTETFSSPTAGLITKTGTAAKPIIFQKDGVGANPIITSGTGVGSYDGIIILHGTDYITFDGIDVRDNVANVNNTTRMEWGYALLKTSGTNGVSNATIKNCTITLQSANTNTRGILINNQNINGGSISVSALTGIHQNNTIKNNTINTAFIGIYLYGQSAVAYNDSNNLVSGNTIDDFEQYGIYSYYQKYDTIYNNTIKNATYTSTLYGVNKWYGTNSVIAQNTIRDLSTSSSGSIYGIYIYSSPQINVTGNILKDYSGVSQVFGINASYTVSPIIEKNRISRFTSTYASFPAVNGINCDYGNTFSKIINNTISNLNAPNASGYYYIVNGIYLNSDAEVYHNTVYLACTTGGVGTFWTNGVYANTSYNLTMRNNVLINKSTYGTAVAFALSSSDKSKYSTSSNNNLFYSGTPSSTKLVYSHTGNTSYQTLANYKTYIASADANSLSGDITFLSTDIDNANFLHPDPSVQLLVESTGQKITGVDDDMDAVGSRITYPKVGQLNGGGWAPDLGAVEYDGTPMPGLGGTKTVGTGKDYATIEAAISALNTLGAAPGGVVFAVDAGHTETFTTATAGVIESGGASDRLVTFRKEGVGANPLITAPEGVGALDGIIVFNGSDYVVIDGIDVQEDNTNNTDDTKRMEWGYAILKKDATDGAKNITIKNCTITLNKTSGNTTYGIYINNHTPSSLTPLSISNASGQTDYVTTENNTITNVYNGLYSLGHTSYTNTYLNVKGNTINDYIQYGIYLQNESNDSIHRNTIKNASSTTTAFGIYTTNVYTLIAQRNKISGLSTSSASDAVYGIYINGGLNSKLYHNRITSLTANSSTNANAVNGIYLMGNTDVIYNSVVLSCSAGGIGFGSNALYANTSYSISVK